jgi:alkylated DNA nucleotide flippase Atl1
MSKKMTALEKMRNAKPPHIVRELPEKLRSWLPAQPRHGGTMVISSPAEIDHVMRQVPDGALTTAADIAAALARRHKTDIACPLTTGIFINIAAAAASELRAAGEVNVTPFWRTLKKDGSLNEKYPGGTEAQAQMLRAEGHTVIQKGKRWLVQDFEARRVTL